MNSGFVQVFFEENSPVTKITFLLMSQSSGP